jgi:aminopeptidase N
MTHETCRPVGTAGLRRRIPRATLAGLALGVIFAGTVEGQTAPPEPEPIRPGVRAPAGTYENTGLDVLHYDVELSLSDDADWILGSVQVRLQATRPGVERVDLDFTGLAVTEVTVDGTGTQASQADGRVGVVLGRTLDLGEEAVVHIRYRGVPDDALVLRDNIHGKPSAFVDNWPNRARFWLPSVDHPSDKATARLTVHAPAEWEVVANGRLVGQPYATPPDEGARGPESGPQRTWVYNTEVPLPTYTLVVGAAEMEVTSLGTAACGRAPASSRRDGCIEVTTWLFPESLAAASPSFVRAVEMVDFFADVIGPFPYEKLAHVQSSTRFGGMENSSAIFYDEGALASGRNIEGTVSHEIAHQWFGDSVTPRSWSHLWLSEGFATYLGDVFFEYADGAESFRGRMEASARSYLTSPDTLGTVVDTTSQNLFDLLNRNSYQKGGWVLHMLRGVVGDDAFFEAIREYYRRYANGSADSEDFQAVVEEVTDTELDWFFEQWLHKPGYPILQVESGSDGASGDLSVTLIQVQGDYAPRFRLPLEIELRWDGEIRRERILLEEARETFRFPGVPASAQVVVDPGGRILKRLAGGS